MLVSTQSLREQMPSSVDAVLELTRRGVAVLGSLGTGYSRFTLCAFGEKCCDSRHMNQHAAPCD